MNETFFGACIVFLFNLFLLCAYALMGAIAAWSFLDKQHEEDLLFRRILHRRLLAYRLSKWLYDGKTSVIEELLSSWDCDIDALDRFRYKPEIRPKTVNLYVEGCFNAYLEDMSKKNDEELP